MIPRICPICGKELSDNATVCPCCNHTLPPRVQLEPVDLDKERKIISGFLAQAYENPDNLGKAYSEIKSHLEKYKTILSKYAHKYMSEVLEDAYEDAAFSWKCRKEANNKQAKKALQELNVLSNRKSNYGGLGFSVITDGAGAAAYAALDAAQGHVHDVTQARVNAKLAMESVGKLTVDSNNGYYASIISEAIDEILYHIGFMMESKVFVEEHRDFYTGLGETEKMFGINLHYVVSSGARSNDFVYWHAVTQDLEPYIMLEAAGYIRLCRNTGRHRSPYHYSTGKYETEVLRERYRKDHPQEVAADKAAVTARNKNHCMQAEEALKQNHYYRAATRFAQTADDRNALRRSIKIWNQHLMQLPEMTCGYMLGADGNAQSIFTSLSMHIPFNEKLYAEGVKYRDIHPCGDRQYVGLSVDGRVYSSSENIFGDLKPSRSELGTAYLPGNGSEWTNITAIACSGNHLVGLRTDGTVCAVGSNTSGQCNLSGWADIIAIEAVKNSTAAIKKDGTVLLAGAIAEYASEVSKWSKIARLYLRENGLIGLRADGQVLAAGKTGFDNQVISRWRNVVRIHWFSDGVFAISDAGDVFCVSSDPLTEILCRNLTGIVSIIHFRSHRGSAFEHRPSLIALRANGTVYTTGVTANVSDWSEIVYVYCEERNTPNLVALNAKGEFLFYGPLFANMEPKENPFSHIDTYAEQQRNMLEEVLEHKKMLLSKAKGLFAGKRRKELQGSIDFLQNKLARMDT